MVTASKIKPFYEPGAPQPTMPVLTVQSSFIFLPNCPPTTLTKEVPLGPTPNVLHLAALTAPTPHRQPSIPPIPRQTSVALQLRGGLSSSARRPHIQISLSPSPDGSEPLPTSSSNAESMDIGEDGASMRNKDSEDDGLILALIGVNQRCRSGRYNLEAELAWNTKRYAQLKVGYPYHSQMPN